MSIENWNEDSILSRAGYTADGSLSTTGRIIRIDRAIDGNIENALEAISHLKWLINDRGDRNPHANRIWKEDLEYICRSINSGLSSDPVKEN